MPNLLNPQQCELFRSFNSTFVDVKGSAIEMEQQNELWQQILDSMLPMGLFSATFSATMLLEKKEEFRRTKLGGGNGGLRLVLSL